MARQWGLALPAALMLVGVVSAGCIDDGKLDASGVLDPALSAAPAAAFSASDCYEGGFVAAYKGLSELPGGWMQADIWEEIGKPLRDGVGAPNPPGQQLSGNWHQGIKCKAATYDGRPMVDLMFGFVGDAIQAPAFDPGGADLHFIVSVTSLQGGDVRDAFRDVTKAGISATTEARIDFLAGDLTTPRFATYVIFSTEDNGDYLSYSEMAKYREVGPRTIRLWWAVPTDGSPSPLGNHHVDVPPGVKWHPIYFDITTQGGSQWTTPPADSAEAACHMGVDDHGPQGGACQPTHTVIYEHEALTFSFGGLLRDVVLEEYFHH